MKIINGLIYQENEFISKTLFLENGRISNSCTDDEIFDAKDCYVIPGLIDIHFHGCMGYDFCDGSTDALNAMAKYEFSQGITSICPASMTLEKSELIHICNTAKDWSVSNSQHQDTSHFVGINLEGPFVSHQKCGAQNPAFIVPADYDMLKSLHDASGKIVKLLAIAPETEGALDFIKKVNESPDFSGIKTSIAHTTADYDTSIAAFQAGASHVTHLFNAMPPFTHREPGVIGAAFDTPDCFAEIICDGVHIKPSAIRAAFAMFTDERLVLISDSMMATGLSDGMYSLGGQEVTVTGNQATLKNGTLAGSVTNLMDCMRTAISMGISLESAIKCATINPAKAIGIDSLYGSLSSGKIGDCVILNQKLEVVKVLKGY